MSKIPKLPDVIRRYIDAYNNANVRVMLDCLTDDVVFQNISKGKVSLNIKSKRKFESFAKMGVEAFTSRQQTVVEAVTRGNTIIAKIDYEAIVANNLPNGWRAGQVVKFPGVSTFVIEGEKLAKIVDES